MHQFGVLRRCALSFGAARTVDAKRYRRVELEALLIDWLVAAEADAILAVIDTLQGDGYPPQGSLAPTPGCLCHCLRLHRVHARQAADLRLIELDNCRRTPGRFRICLKFGSQSQQPRTHVLHHRPHRDARIGFSVNPVKLGRMFPEPYFVNTNGIRMAVHEQGQGPVVILLHGFPELAFSWRHQLPAVAAAGFRAIAPDQRGYGKTSVPPRVSDYRIDELIADVHGLLDALGLESAIFIGHDWGALLLWQMAMLAPERIEKLVILNIPHYPRSTEDPISIWRKRFGDDFYIVSFQDSDEADRVFASDPAHFFDVTMRRRQISRERFDKLPAQKKIVSLIDALSKRDHGGEPLLTKDERDYYASAYAASGFTGPINWYRNWTDNWRQLEGVDQTIRIPTLFIGADDDVLIAPEHIAGMKPLVNDLEIHMLKCCGHWSQQEKPNEVNRLIVDWLVKRR